MSLSRWQKPIAPSTVKLVSWAIFWAVVWVMAGQTYALARI